MLQLFYCNTECRYTECRYAECRYTEYCCAECHYTERRYAVCRSAHKYRRLVMSTNVLRVKAIKDKRTSLEFCDTN